MVRVRISLSGALGRREMNVAYDLVYSHETSNIATFRCLLLDMIGPVFLNALNQPPQEKLSLFSYLPCTQTQTEDKIGGGHQREASGRAWSTLPGLPKLQPLRVYASRTELHTFQHPPSEVRRNSKSRNSPPCVACPTCQCRYRALRLPSPGQPSP